MARGKGRELQQQVSELQSMVLSGFPVSIKQGTAGKGGGGSHTAAVKTMLKFSKHNISNKSTFFWHCLMFLNENEQLAKNHLKPYVNHVYCIWLKDN